MERSDGTGQAPRTAILVILAVPLAALTDEARGHLAEVVDRIEARLKAEASPALTERLLAGTFLLLGLRYLPPEIPERLRRNKLVEESSTYQMVRQIGRIEGVRHTLLRQGSHKFGQPEDPATQSRIDSITDIEQLDALIDRIPFVSSWADLLSEV